MRGLLGKFNSQPSDEEIVLPRDWTNKQKWNNVILISFQAAFTPIASTMLEAGTKELAADFNLTDTFSPSLPIALFLLALGVGPLFLGPLSEIFGKRIIYIVCFTLFALLNLACGFAPNIITLAVLRFLAGLAGSASTTLSGATVGDMFGPSERAKAQAIYGAAPVLGPVIGGILGGYIISATGNWRWTMWIMAILPGVSSIACIFFLKETYAPYIMRKHGLEDPTKDMPEMAPKNRFASTILRPIRFLFLSPICAIMAIYVGVGYGIFYFHVVTVPLIFGPLPVGNLFSYQWSASNTGLAYIGIGVGSMIGVVLAATTMNRMYAYTLEKMSGNSYVHTLEDRINRLEYLLITGQYKELDCEHCECSINPFEDEEEIEEYEDCPEARLPFLFIASCISPLGLIIVAWTISPYIHWIFPLIGAGIFAGGMIMAYISIQNYLVDTFGDYAASALAAAALLRSPIACGLSLISTKAYETLNYNWGTMLLAFVLMAGIPAPIVLFYWGKRLRTIGATS